MRTYRVTKTWDIGLSCCFRQWRAESHCQQLHGYDLVPTVEFEAKDLDPNGWVIDFGSLGPVKDWLCETFDHALLVARDDPALEPLLDLRRHGAARVIVLDAVGCERFAELIHDRVTQWLDAVGQAGRVRVARVEVRERGANAASIHDDGLRDGVEPVVLREHERNALGRAITANMRFGAPNHG